MIISLQLKFYKIIIYFFIALSLFKREIKATIKNILNVIRIGRGLSKFSKLVFRGDNSGDCSPDY